MSLTSIGSSAVDSVKITRDSEALYDQIYNQVYTGDTVFIDDSPFIGKPTTITTHVPNLQLTDESLIEIGDNFQITGRDLRHCLNVLLKIVEQDYPEELL